MRSHSRIPMRFGVLATTLPYGVVPGRGPAQREGMRRCSYDEEVDVGQIDGPGARDVDHRRVDPLQPQTAGHGSGHAFGVAEQGLVGDQARTADWSVIVVSSSSVPDDGAGTPPPPQESAVTRATGRRSPPGRAAGRLSVTRRDAEDATPVWREGQRRVGSPACCAAPTPLIRIQPWRSPWRQRPRAPGSGTIADVPTAPAQEAQHTGVCSSASPEQQVASSSVTAFAVGLSAKTV